MGFRLLSVAVLAVTGATLAVAKRTDSPLAYKLFQWELRYPIRWLFNTDPDALRRAADAMADVGGAS